MMAYGFHFSFSWCYNDKIGWNCGSLHFESSHTVMRFHNSTTQDKKNFLVATSKTINQKQITYRHHLMSAYHFKHVLRVSKEQAKIEGCLNCTSCMYRDWFEWPTRDAIDFFLSVFARVTYPSLTFRLWSFV